MSKKRVNKRILNLLKDSKKTVLFFMILFSLVFAGYIYMVDDRYESQCSIDVGEGISSSVNHDIIDGMIKPNKMDIYTKIAFLKSPSVLEEVVVNIPIQKRWYKKEKFKWKPIDNEIPFDVKLKGAKDLFLTIHPLSDKKYYKLSVRKKNDLWSHEIDKNYKYGSWVEEEGVKVKVSLKDTHDFDSKNIYGLKQLSVATALDMLQKYIVIKQMNAESSLISISCYADSPKLSQDICMNLMKVYHLKDIQKRTQEATQTLAFIDEQLQKIDSNILNVDNNISKNIEETELFTPKAKKDLLLQKQIKYNETLEHTQETIKHLEIFQKKFKQNVMTIESGDVLSSNILDLLKRLHDAEYKRKQLRRDYTALHPAVKVVSLEISHYRILIEKSIKLRKENLIVRSKNLKKKLEKIQNKFKALPHEEKIYNDLEKKFVVNEQIYAYFLQKRATTAIVKASIMHKNKMIKSPTYSNTPIYPHRLMFIVYGLCFGLLLGIVFVLIREYLSDKIKNEAYVREYSTMSLLGTLPHSKNQHLIEVFGSPKSLMSESLRVLRGNLQFLSAKEKGLVLSVTSTISGEGKTAVSSNLAAIISLRNQKVIVLNMDLRKPTLHHKFKADNTIGISNYLSRHNGIEDVIQHTEYENIDIIASGPIPPNPSELIENGRIDELIGELKMSYDVIILDTPPIGLVNDAMTLMRLSDIVLYVLREGYSKKIFLDEVERLRDIHKISTISLVLNDVKKVKDGYGYYEE